MSHFHAPVEQDLSAISEPYMQAEPRTFVVSKGTTAGAANRSVTPLSGRRANGRVCLFFVHIQKAKIVASFQRAPKL
jgi:hypothetical protein